LDASISELEFVSGAIRCDEKASRRPDAAGSQVTDVLEAHEIRESGNEKLSSVGAKQIRNISRAEADVGVGSR
jgi:hypothetical protein